MCPTGGSPAEIPLQHMKIIGLQGLDDPQSIRAEVDRGARFVVYIYCVSVIVMTFGR